MSETQQAVSHKRQVTETRSQKIFGMFNLLFAAAISALSLCCLIVFRSMGDPENRTFTCAAISVVVFAPYLLQAIFRTRFSNSVLLFFFVYLTFAGVLGCVFNLYVRVSWYDNLMHGLFGYVGSVVGLFLLAKLGEYSKLKAATVGLICFAVSMACGAVWEIFEFTTDVFFGQAAQGVRVETVTGEMITPVIDTMQDILMNFTGAIVFLVHYSFFRATNKNLLLGSMIRDFTQE